MSYVGPAEGTPADGAAAVMKLAAMVHLLEGSDSPKYQRLIRRAEALRATSHHHGSSSFLGSNNNNNSNPGMASFSYSSSSSPTNRSVVNGNGNISSISSINSNVVVASSGGGGGGGGVLATEGASSMATLAGAHAARGDYLEASRLQQRCIDFEVMQCRRGIREWKRAMDRTERANEVSRFPEEPLLVKRDDLIGAAMSNNNSNNNSASNFFFTETTLCPPNLRGQLAVIADLYETLGDYQEAANNHLECSASRRKARTLRNAITF